MAPLPLNVTLHADPENQPPPLTPETLLTAWTFEPWVVAALVLMIGLYLWGVRRLAARGDAWPLGRTLAWCVGAAGVVAIALEQSDQVTEALGARVQALQGAARRGVGGLELQHLLVRADRHGHVVEDLFVQEADLQEQVELGLEVDRVCDAIAVQPRMGVKS